jgi:hypothetical protein
VNRHLPDSDGIVDLTLKECDASTVIYGTGKLEVGIIVKGIIFGASINDLNCNLSCVLDKTT